MNSEPVRVLVMRLPSSATMSVTVRDVDVFAQAARLQAEMRPDLAAAAEWCCVTVPRTRMARWPENPPWEAVPHPE